VAGTVFARGAAGLPPNDMCANATQVQVPALNTWVTVQSTSADATSDIAMTCGIEDSLDVWFSFTAPVTGRWYFDTLGSILYDTTLSAYSSCGGVQLACNDDIDINNAVQWSALALTMVAGQTIKLRAAANNNDADLVRLNVVGLSSVSLNSCATAEALTLNVPKSGTNMEATTDFVLPWAMCGQYTGSAGAADVFYSYTPAVSQGYTVSACTTNFDTILAVLRDCTGSAGSVIGCNDESVSCNSLVGSSQVTNVQLTAGTRYLIRVAGFDFPPGDRGEYTVVVGAVGAGICCRGATCVPLTSDNCAPTGLAGALQRVQQVCNPASAVTPCCHADYNKINGVTTQDIFDFLNDWFGGLPTTATGTDGTVNPTIQHIFDFLNGWFAGC
jgi:hypothetical protein